MKVIAEIGSNWKTTDDLLSAPLLAKECGATTIKYQYFSSNELYGESYAAVDRYHIPLTLLEKIKLVCDEVEIEFMCSAFSVKGYEEINDLVSAHKVASSESNYLKMIYQVIGYHKDVYLSVGGATFSLIKQLTRVFERLCFNDQNLILMYCDPSYPSNKKALEVYYGLNRLRDYGYDVGYSDHSTFGKKTKDFDKENYLPYLNLHSVEKHFNPYDYTDTPDATENALNIKEFTEFTNYLKTVDNYYTYNKHKRIESKGEMYRPLYKES